MKKPIIVANRMGGLGNQLFQYAAAKAVAHYHPNSLIIMEPERDNPHNRLGYNYANILIGQEDDTHHPLDLDDTPLPAFKQGSAFMPWHPQHVCPPIQLHGYFQYLPAIQPILDGLIGELVDALGPFRSRHEDVDEEKTVFMHVRRGDYLRLPDFHYIQPTTYYEKAFNMWKQIYPYHDDYKLYILSDDPEWCSAQPWTFQYTIYNSKDELETIALMSKCKAGAIIGNSTFSYWGALLSKTDKVFYPRQWIGEPIYGLFPTEWVCV